MKIQTQQHTPGPWTCDPSDTDNNFPARQRVYSSGRLVAEVCGNGKGQSGANAVLIAAAPELLTVLKQLRVEAECCFDDILEFGNIAPNHGKAYRRAKQLATAAIAKAEGRAE